MTQVRIALADDHALVRAGLRSLLENIPGFEVVGEADNGNEALQVVRELQPDVVLMDLSMPRLNGLEVTRRLPRQNGGPRVLVLSMHAHTEYVRQALAAGAAGYLLKNADRGELEMAIRAVTRGQLWLSPAISRIVTTALVRGVAGQSAVEKLTSRQREILQLIAEGNSTRKIAQFLRLSVKTVETHRANLMERLGIHDVASLAVYAVRVGLIQVD